MPTSSALAAVAGAPVISANESSDGSTGAAAAATTTSADALVLQRATACVGC